MHRSHHQFSSGEFSGGGDAGRRGPWPRRTCGSSCSGGGTSRPPRTRRTASARGLRGLRGGGSRRPPSPGTWARRSGTPAGWSSAASRWGSGRARRGTCGTPRRSPGAPGTPGSPTRPPPAAATGTVSNGGGRHEAPAGGLPHPRTPSATQQCSKRSWDGQVRKWRRLLHAWDPPPESESGKSDKRPRCDTGGAPPLGSTGPWPPGHAAPHGG